MDLLSRARAAFSRGLHAESAHFYLRAGEEEPSCRRRLRDEILGALSFTLDHLKIREDRSHLEAFSLLVNEISSSYLSADKLVLRMLGTKCLDEGILQQAQALLAAAITVDPDCPSIRESLREVHEQMVTRWHFHMLNDVARNSAYFRAIRKAVGQISDCIVLDIGSGTGILRFGIQWSPSLVDTNGPIISVQYSEVSLS